MPGAPLAPGAVAQRPPALLLVRRRTRAGHVGGPPASHLLRRAVAATRRPRGVRHGKGEDRVARPACAEDRIQN
eukprot:10495205-Alexandrium_andersonii.AAC.1